MPSHMTQKYSMTQTYIMFVRMYNYLEYGDLRISGGGSSGRLEIQDRSGRWGTICDSGFDDNAGDVACSQLGYDRSSDVYTDRRYVHSYILMLYIQGKILK